MNINEAYKCRAQNFAVKTHDGYIADVKNVYLTANTVDLALYNEDGYEVVNSNDEYRKSIDPATLEIVPRMDGDTPYYPK